MPAAPLPSRSHHAADADPTAPRAHGRWATAGWLLSLAAVLVVMTGLYTRVRDTSGGGALQGAIAAGERPRSPALPNEPLLAGDDAADGLHGRVLIVNFWASWCGPCRDESPMLDRFHRRYEDRGVAVVGVNAGAEDSLRDARAFARSYELRYPMLRATKAQVDAWGVHNYPETFVVGRDGRISARVAGPVEEATLRELVGQELQRKDASS